MCTHSSGSLCPCKVVYSSQQDWRHQGQKAKRTNESLFVHVLCHAVLELFPATWTYHTRSRSVLHTHSRALTQASRSINMSPRWYLSEARDLRLPLRLVEFAPALFGATSVWLMCLRWISSAQKPFKSQSSCVPQQRWRDNVVWWKRNGGAWRSEDGSWG